MNNRVVFIVLSIVLMFISCKKDDTLSCVKEMLDNKIELNLEQMELIDCDNSGANTDSRYVMVCYYDSTECQTCATSKLYTWNNFMKKYGKPQQMDYVFIFHPTADSHQYLRAFLMGKKEKKSIYLDTLKAFEKANPFIPHSSIYHTMLIDKKDSRIKLVGDPRRSPKIEKLFVDIINKHP